MAKGAEEFNIPAFRENRKLVASEDGGLNNPSVLVFSSLWDGNKNKALDASKKFNYSFHEKVQRPSKDENVAFMTVSSIPFYIVFPMQLIMLGNYYDCTNRTYEVVQ
jgi:hypothetical protein